jgi:hypothetical protein
MILTINAGGARPRTSHSHCSRPHSKRRFAEATVFFKQNYSALRAVDQRRIESALTAVGRKRAEFGAADVCEAIADALDCNEGNAIKTCVADLITAYVAAAAEIWRQHGIRPARLAPI